ncbi:Cell division control protein 1 [Sphaceloma murrayae]|uniref:Cell division control protein 1 n=1 Tax=Sphaceloma murrayae TaxID=2082308 RepID=A0A2K1R3T5_9PEZI|nr:Cell division control protein 1 [Sphaceloma murrayae]
MFKLPQELLDVVCSYLDRASVARLAQCSGSLTEYQSFLPSVYHTVHVVDRRDTQEHSNDDCAYIEWRHLIRFVVAQGKSPLASDSIKDLTASRLSVGRRLYGEQRTTLDEADRSKLRQRAQCFVLDGEKWIASLQHGRSLGDSWLAMLLTTAKNIEKLSITFDRSAISPSHDASSEGGYIREILCQQGSAPASKNPVYQHFHQLRDLTLDSFSHIIHPNDQNKIPRSNPASPLVALSRLALLNLYTPPDFLSLSAMIFTLPPLHTLLIATYRPSKSPYFPPTISTAPLQSALKPHASSLRNLTITNTAGIDQVVRYDGQLDLSDMTALTRLHIAADCLSTQDPFPKSVREIRLMNTHQDILMRSRALVDAAPEGLRTLVLETADDVCLPDLIRYGDLAGKRGIETALWEGKVLGWGIRPEDIGEKRTRRVPVMMDRERESWWLVGWWPHEEGETWTGEEKSTRWNRREVYDM